MFRRASFYIVNDVFTVDESTSEPKDNDYLTLMEHGVKTVFNQKRHWILDLETSKI